MKIKAGFIFIILLLTATLAGATITSTFSNFYYGTLTSSVSSGATTIAVTPGTNAGSPPAGYFKAMIYAASCTNISSCAYREVITLEHASGTTYNIIGRAEEGTSSPSSWAAGSKVAVNLTAGNLDEIISEINNKLDTDGDGSALTGLTQAQISGLVSALGSKLSTTGNGSQLTGLTQSQISGLVTALASKLTATGDGSQLTGLTQGQISGLVSSLASKLSATADGSGLTGLTTSQITDLAAALAAKLSTTGNGSGLTGLTQSQISGLTGALASKLSTTGDGSGLTGLSKTQVGIPLVENTALSTWHGTSNITTVGTVTSGAWQAGAIGDSYIASASTWNAKQTRVGGTCSNGNAIRVINSDGSVTCQAASSGTWGSISGTLSAQADLNTALSSKLSSTGDGSGLSGLTQGQISGLTTALSSKLSAAGDGSGLTGLTKAQVGLPLAENTALSTWAGSANITTVGTVGSGSWRGTAIGDAYLSSASTWNGKQSRVTGTCSSGNAIASILADGTVTCQAASSGTWGSISGTLSAQADLNTALSSKLSSTGDGSGLTGITKTTVGIPLVENTALSTWAGSANLTTLGTIGTGVWHGSAIADGYISSASTWNAKADTTRATDAFGALTDVTTNNATTLKHGFLPKLGGGSTNFLRADGTWAAPTSGGSWGSISGTLSAQADLNTALVSRVTKTTGIGPCIYGISSSTEGCYSSWNQDFSTNTLGVPSGSTLPGTCTANQLFNLTSGTSGQRLYICESANSWVKQGDGGGSSVSSGAQYQFAYYPSAGSTVSGDAKLTDDGTTLAYTGTKFTVGGTQFQFYGPENSSTPANIAGQDYCYASSTDHAILCSFNNDAYSKLVRQSDGLLTAPSGTAPVVVNNGVLATSTNLNKDVIAWANLISSGSTTIEVGPVPWNGTITASNIYCQETSTFSADIYTAPTNTTTFTKISASAPVAVSNAQTRASDTTLTGWTTAFTAGKWFRAVFNGFTGGPCAIGLTVTKSN